MERNFILWEILALLAIIFHGIYLFGTVILTLLLVTYVISTVAELISLKTPIYCFGIKYRYNLAHPFFSSKISILDVYPLEISFAWVIFKYASFCLGILISSAFSLPKLIEIALIPLILVSTDFIIDPVSVNVKKLWQWEKGTRYFGIPWQNFLGWYLVGLVSTIIFSLAEFGNSISFNYLFFLPVFLYAGVFKSFPLLYKLNNKMAIIGSIPALSWILLSTVSLFVLRLR